MQSLEELKSIGQLLTSTGADTSDLAVKNDFIAFKAEVDKVDINKLV